MARQVTVRREPLTACPLCGSAQFSPVLQGFDFDCGTGDYQVDQCQACGMCFTNPQPVPQDVPLLYDDRSFDELPREGSVLGKVRATRARRRLSKLAPLFPSGQLACADIGTGDGFFALQLSRMPFCASVTASDFFPQAPAALAQAKRARYVGYDEFFTLSDTYDVVFARFVLEHVRDPVRFIRDVRERLRPGGAIVIDVPNWRSTWRRAFGKFYSELSLPAHTNHFAPDTLRRLLSDFDVHIFEDMHGMVLRRSLGNVLGTSGARTSAGAMALLAVEMVVDTVAGPPPNMTAVARVRG